VIPLLCWSLLLLLPCGFNGCLCSCIWPAATSPGPELHWRQLSSSHSQGPQVNKLLEPLPAAPLSTPSYWTACWVACQPWWQQGCWLTHPASPVVVCVNVFRSHQVCGSAAEPQALIACKGPTVYVARPQCAASCHTMGGNSPTSNCSATPSCGVSMPGC